MLQNFFIPPNLFYISPVIRYTESAVANYNLKVKEGYFTIDNFEQKIKAFWELYPNGSISNKLPEKNEAGDGIIATCLLYSDRRNIPDSLIVQTHAERSAVLPEDNTDDIYEAVYDAALSEALSIALNGIFE